MTSTRQFSFGKQAYDTSHVFYARLSSDIYRQEQLLEALYYLLWFPGYFGFNWNALFDCLRDLSWIKEQVIVLVHDGLPKLPSDELKIYLQILRDAAASWKPSDEHRLEIVFDEADRGKIVKILGD